MRWIVEVTSLEKSADSQSYCVEAESWQGALQSARRLRGDDSRMAGFSIDITNEGCKAVDPASRRRYDVKRTTDDAPLTPGGDVPPPSRRSKPPSSKKDKKTPVPAAAATVRKLPDQTMPMAAVSSDIQLPDAPSDKKIPAAAPSKPAVPKPAPSKPASKPEGRAKPVNEPPVPPTVITREQNPTAEVPLTYREYGFVVPAGTTEDAAAQILLVQYARIKRNLESAPPGKLVNLAAFDVVFEGPPPVKPVATLTWKDWRGEPTTAFPRRKKKSSAPPPVAVAAPVVIPQAAPVPVIAAPVAPAPVAPAPAPVVAAPAPVAPAPAPVVAAPAPVAVAPAPVASAPPPAPAKPASIPPPAPKAPSKPPPPAVVATTSTPPVSGRRRVNGEELISVLFEAMHDLHFQRDAVEGAAFCLRLALEQLPSRFGMVYFYDIDKREFVIVSVQGPQAPNPTILLRRTSESEPAFAQATRRRRALILKGEELAAHGAVVGSAKSVILAPVMDVGRFLGAIELVDPEDGHDFTELDANALSYMAQQLAEFASARGIIVDPERVTQTAQTRAR